MCTGRTQQAIVHPALTERELEVVTMLAKGYTNKDVARRLGVTPKTVMHHHATIYRKLDVRGRAGAVAAAMRFGLLHEGQHAAST